MAEPAFSQNRWPSFSESSKPSGMNLRDIMSEQLVEHLCNQSSATTSEPTLYKALLSG